MAGSLLQRQESQVLCVVAGWHLANFETHLMGPWNYPTFPHSWHLPTASTDTTGVSARDWGRGAAHADEAIKTVGARDNAQADHRRDTGEASAWYSGDQDSECASHSGSMGCSPWHPSFLHWAFRDRRQCSHTPQFRVLNSCGNQVLWNWMGSKNIHDLRSTAGKFLDNKHHVPKMLRSSRNQLTMEIN